MSLTLSEILRWAARGGCKHLRVPTYITKLICGCTKELKDNNFIIKKTAHGWVHDEESGGCGCCVVLDF